MSDTIEQAVKDFFELLDRTDESESGKVFHPIQISCCRALWTPEIGRVLDRMKKLSGAD